MFDDAGEAPEGTSQTVTVLADAVRLLRTNCLMIVVSPTGTSYRLLTGAVVLFVEVARVVGPTMRDWLNAISDPLGKVRAYLHVTSTTAPK
jgi:hypothetical protein